MRFIKRLRRTTRQYITVAFICIAVIGTAAIVTSVTMIGQIRQEYEQMLNETRQELERSKKTVLVALTDIETGEIITEELIEERLVYSSQPAESYISKSDLGKAAIIDIPEGTHIIRSMVAQNEVSSIQREVEYDVIHISSNIKANDFVDVRILYPNGETYVVLTKKQLKGYQPDMPICYLWVDEEELLRMSAAIVDAGLYTGSKLYMTKYIEPNIQEASIITYTPSISVLNLIENDPNIVDRCSQLLNIEVRKALENRLAKSMDMDVKNINWELKDTIRYMPEAGKEHLSANAKEDAKDNAKANIKDRNESIKEDNNKSLGYIEEDINHTEENLRSADFNKQDYMDDNKDELTEKEDTDNITRSDIFYFPELGQIYDENYFIPVEG